MDDFELWEAELTPAPVIVRDARRPNWTADRPNWAPSPYAQPAAPRRWWQA